MKNIMLFTFCPKRITKKYIEKSVYLRIVLIISFLIECICLSINLLVKQNNLTMKSVIIISIIGSFWGTYICNAIQAVTLYVIDRILLKKILLYKVCFKLILPSLIVDVLCGIIVTMLVVLGVSTTKGQQFIISTCKITYFIAVLSYYLKEVYKCRTIHIVVTDVIYLFFTILPGLLNVLMFNNQ